MKRAYFHSNRFFYADSPQGGGRGWYFEVREGAPRGPYASRELAGMALGAYVGRMRDARRASDNQPFEEPPRVWMKSGLISARRGFADTSTQAYRETRNG